jgi:dienelactone hydrolase
VVAVPDIYHEQEAPGSCLAYDGPGADRGNALKVGKPMDAYDSDAATAIEYLQRHPCSTGKVPPCCLMSRARRAVGRITALAKAGTMHP